MIVLNVTYKCRPELREEFLEAILREGIDEASRKEPGNLKYDYYIPFDGGDDLLLVEKWRDEAALKAHAETPHYAKLKELKPQYVTETILERFELPDVRKGNAEEQTVTVTVRTKGEPCALTDAEIKAWYAERVASLFDPQWGTPEITVDVERNPL
ncbi:MAG: antibiotic biosynthesis monooxygenase [Clostridia bacterium]|nr:antibiotic biosynthesis monooxygenase [Clostridia bacterium]